MYETLQKQIKKQLKTLLQTKFDGLDYTLRLTQGSYPFVTDSNTDVVKNMQKSIKTICNIDTKLSTAGGTSDARVFGKYKIPTVEFGVKNDSIHSINEKTETRYVEQLTEVFEDIIKEW